MILVVGYVGSRVDMSIDYGGAQSIFVMQHSLTKIAGLLFARSFMNWRIHAGNHERNGRENLKNAWIRQQKLGTAQERVSCEFLIFDDNLLYCADSYVMRTSRKGSEYT